MADIKATVHFGGLGHLVNLGKDRYLNTIQSSSNLSFKSQILESFRATGKKHTDESFMPVRSSLIKNWGEADLDTQRTWKNFGWRRVSEIYQQPIKVFDNIEPNDIQQGALGNCYFLSALAALAEFPHRIQRLFDTQEYEPSGAYVVYMCDLGEIKPFVVDDYLPCTPLGKPAFSGPKVEKGTSELWVVVLEKAWAKRFGCYYKISEGITNDALRDFTGAPCEDISSDNDHLWGELVQADHSNFIITAASGGSEDEQDQSNALGLIGLHAYSLIKVAEFDRRGDTTKLVQIRNPWGGTEWTGDWSDNSPLWTDELKEALGWSAENDGTFWMNFEDFKSYFSSVTICRAHDDFHYKNIQAKQAIGGFQVFEVEVSGEALLYAMVTHLDERKTDSDSGYEYSTTRIIGAHKDPDTGVLHYLGGRANSCLRDVWEEFKCPKRGTYVFYVEIEWATDYTENFGFSIYSSEAVTITNATLKYQNYPTLVYNIETARLIGKPRELGSGMMMYSGVRSGTSNDFKFMEGFAFDAFENQTSDLRLNMEVVYKSLSNLELLAPYTKTRVNLSLGPGESAVLVKKQDDMMRSQSYSLAMKKQIVPN